MTRGIRIHVHKLFILRGRSYTGFSNIVIEGKLSRTGHAFRGIRLNLLPTRISPQERYDPIHDHHGGKKSKSDGKDKAKLEMAFVQLRFNDRLYRRFFFTIPTTHDGFLSLAGTICIVTAKYVLLIIHVCSINVKPYWKMGL